MKPGQPGEAVETGHPAVFIIHDDLLTGIGRAISDRCLVSLFAAVLMIMGSGCASQHNGIEFIDEAVGELSPVGQEICQAARSGRMWQSSKSRAIASFQEAEQYAAGLELGGYDDWRLPTKEELFDLHYIFLWEKNGNCAMNRKGNFWSASQEGRSSLGHWETFFLCAPEYRYVTSQGTRGYVRAVRP